MLAAILLALPAGCARGEGGRGPVTLRADDPALSDLAFLTGAWVSDSQDRARRVEEHWTQPTAGTMFGSSRTIENGRTAFFEYVRIERRGDGIYYVASPRGRGETAFKLIHSSPGRAVFENAEHDFPQRIVYERTTDGRLNARIEGTDRGRPRSETWWYRPARVVATGG